MCTPEHDELHFLATEMERGYRESINRHGATPADIERFTVNMKVKRPEGGEPLDIAMDLLVGRAPNGLVSA